MRRLCVIGHPIAHSLSPRIHNAFYAALGIPAHYGALAVPKGGVARFLAGDAARYDGFNATMPHKEALAALLGAAEVSVNTAFRRDGGWKAVSTDGDGLLDALSRAGFSANGARVLVLGAGGAAIAMQTALKAHGAAQVSLASRSGTPPLEGSALPTDIDLLINATPLGMAGFPEGFPGYEGYIDHLSKQALVMDTIYAPRTTPLLAAARASGLQTMNGLPMLLGQAARSHAVWFGTMPPEDLVYEVLSSLEET